MKRIRLTEGDLHRIVNESVNRIIKEGTTDRDVQSMWDEAQEMMGAESMLEALYDYLGSDTIEDFVQVLIRLYELPLSNSMS